MSTLAVAETLAYVLRKDASGQVECRLRHPGQTQPKAISFQTEQRAKTLMQKPYLSGADRRILMRLYMAASGAKDRVLLSGKQGGGIVQEMVETGRCMWDEALDPLSWSEDPARGILTWKLLDPKTQEPVIDLERPDILTLPLVPLLAVDPLTDSIARVETGFPDSFAATWARKGPLNSEQASEFFDELVDFYPDTAPPSPPTIQKEIVKVFKPTPRLNIRQREFLPRQFGKPVRVYVGELWFDYEGQALRYNSATNSANLIRRNRVREIRRDRAFEKGEAKWLERMGLIPVHKAVSGFELEDARDDFTGPLTEPSPWYQFLSDCQGELEARGWTFQFDGKRRVAVADAEEEYCEFEPSERQGWFQFEAGILVNDHRINLLPLVHDLLKRFQGTNPEAIRTQLEPQVFFVPTRSGMTHVFSGKRFYGIVERIFELYDRDPFLGAGRLQVSELRVAELAREFGRNGEIPGISRPMQHLAGVLQEGVTIEPAESPGELKATLRDYQRMGVGWLQFLRSHGVNGVLADDMGLGKTLQTIAHLVAEKAAGRLEEPALLVAPTSLMDNWRREVERFAPHLHVLTLHGSDRKRFFRVVPDADLVLTTYGLVRRDLEWHQEQDYSWVILDEAQFIKNPDSQVTKALAQLQSRHRLCLTGTPVENHLEELWSLFHFLMPGFLGEREAFRRQFRQPIEMDGNEGLRDVLTRRVRPFLLRRKKIEVAKELPPKTEIDHPVEMMEKQKDIYESIRVAMHDKVQSEIAERGLARSQIVILDALMKLRQVCCDPRLARISEEPLKRTDSAKLMELTEMVPNMIQDGHRILLFSQFTSMLSLIEDEMRELDVPFVTLTGATRDRGKCVEAFTSGKVPLFLISLRAGGTGLNLTEADTVIHYDPWWNPAVENQATDRAYRIGQQRPVFAYKMIAEGTVEEKIVEMQRKKAELAEGILSGSGSANLKFEATDVTALFGR